MKIATSSLTHRERKLWRVVVFNTLVNAFEITLAEMDEQHIEFEDDKNFVSFNLYTLAEYESTN